MEEARVGLWEAAWAGAWEEKTAGVWVQVWVQQKAETLGLKWAALKAGE